MSEDDSVYPFAIPPTLPERPNPKSKYLYSNRYRTNELNSWLSTDGPTSWAALNSLRKVVRSPVPLRGRKDGDYEAKLISVEYDGISRDRVQVKGPHRTLEVSPNAIKALRFKLTQIADFGSFRIEPKSKQTASLRKYRVDRDQ